MAKKTRGARSKRKALKRENPKWVKKSKKEIESTILKLHSEGIDTAMIGMRLRDQYGVPNVKLATGKSIAQILKENKEEGNIPEDLANLLKRVVNLHKHMRDNPKDIHNKRGLALIEARIRRLAKYYKEKGVLPKEWKYSSDTVELQIR